MGDGAACDADGEGAAGDALSDGVPCGADGGGVSGVMLSVMASLFVSIVRVR